MGEAEEGASALYDVFINHRGPDTKRTVASLVYRRLVKYGLRVFLDQDELKIGDPLYDKIKSAISSSSVHVAIFSVRYAESAWCLNELSDMLQSGCKVIPIFYNVKPAHLRRIDKGPYAKAFRKHQDNCRYAVELVEKWKNALQKASNISGKEFISKKDDLGDLVDEIVEEVLKEAKWELLYVAEHPVGLHQAENFNNFLKQRQLSGTTVVGIIGLDGSGKSTLVRHLYNCKLESHKFKRYCFLSELNKKDLAVLQHKLVRDLLGDDKYSISDTSNGKRTLRTCLKGCGPVLIVLDGLDKEEQIESLLLVVKKDVLAEGSLILVTCHDKALLEAHQVNLFYQIKLLQVQDAYDLFCWYAFDKPKPPEHLEDLVQKFVEICCGFPLALKILGRKLYVERDRRCWEEQVLGRKLSFRRDRRDWEEQLRDLGRAKLPTSIVEEILKVSYNYLEEEKKEVFLDVAHFLVGEDTDLAVRVLEGLHDTRGLMCLKEFQRKCLLDLEEIDHYKLPLAKGFGIQWRTKWSSKIRMHDLVRKMATQIASENSRSSLPTRPLRLCQLDTRSILQVLQYKGNHVRGIRSEDMDEPDLQYQYINKLQLPGQPHAELNGLRLLVIQDYSFPFPFDRLSGDLIWLRIHKSQWGNTIPPTLLLRNLRVLELDGVKPEALGRMDSDEFPSKLCELTVDYFGESAEIPRRNLPSSSRVDKNSMEASSSAPGSFWDWFRVRELTDLVKMVLKNVRGLKSLPIDFNAVRNLRHLDLSGCFDLEKMPDSFTGLLQLQYLALQDCRSLSISDLGEIAKLEYLDFEGCSLLQKLPDKTTVQRGLRYLNLMDTNIEELPQDLGKLNKLEQLLIKSSYLTTLPRSFGELGQLRILTLSGCFNLRDISSSISIEHFPYLESLQLWDVGVMTVPQGIAWSSVKLLHVKAPHLSEFSFERDQGKMPLDRSHTQESIHDRTKSVEATGHNHVSSLTELRLVETDISNLWGSHTQESIHDRTKSVEATGRNHVSSLTELRLVETDISNLWFPPEESLFPDLEIIDLSGNPRLRDVQSLPCNLKKLYLMNCTALTTLLCLSNLACLRILDISECPNLEALNLEGLRSIEEIKAKDCRELQSIQGSANLSCIRILDIGGCHKLEALNLEGLRSIEEIAEKGCRELQSFQGLVNVACIRVLNISGCHKLEALNLEGLRFIEKIAAKDCCELQSIQGLANLACIRILDISGCHKLEALNVEGLRSIEEIAAKDCCELQSIQGLANLAFMRILDISGCHKLKALNLEGLRSMEEINAEECWNLQSIQGLAQLHTLSSLNFSTFHEDPNSTIWSEILGFPSNVSTAILGGAKVLCMNAEEMDSVKQSILKEIQGATIIDISIIGNEQQVQIKNMELYGAIFLCFITKKHFVDFKVSVDDNVYTISRQSLVKRAEVQEEHEEIPWLYTFMWSQNSNLFEDLTFHGKSVLKCTIQPHYGKPLSVSFREAWIVMIKNRTDGVKICKHLLNSLCCIPKQAVHQAVAL